VKQVRYLSNRLVFALFGTLIAAACDQPSNVRSAQISEPEAQTTNVMDTGLIKSARRKPDAGVQVFAEIGADGRRAFLMVPDTDRAYPVESLPPNHRFPTLAGLAKTLSRMDEYNVYVGQLDSVRAGGRRIAPITSAEAHELSKLISTTAPPGGAPEKDGEP
jgi:hypothetical protein